MELSSKDVENDLLNNAIHYLEKFGFSVIPIKPDKKAYVRWEPYQKRKPTKQEINDWWNQWPSALVGIITGSISNIVVIDIDEEIGHDALSKYIPDSLVTPTVRTPSGGQHLYFKAPEKPISNNTRAIPGCDFRGEGGYVIAPLSVNGTGRGYTWLPGLSIDEVQPADLPSAYQSFINAFVLRGYKGADVTDFNRLQVTSGDFKMFVQGRRDEDLFHVANHLVKSRMPIEEIEQVIEKLALSCDPPFPTKDIPTKIQSALKRIERKDRNLSEEVRDFVLTSSGFFLTSDCFNRLQVTSREEKKAIVLALLRFKREGLIERHGDKNGCYRRVEGECEDINWLNADDTVLSIRYPFEIERYALTLPKNVIVIAGASNAGKTAYLLNLAEMNMRSHKVYYFSSEMGEHEFKKRLSKFDLPLKQWLFTAKERTSNFADVIRPDDINIIDFLEVYDEFYKIGFYIKEIYDKLQKGIAVIAIQKNLNTDYGLGGMRGLEKARLYLAMEGGKIKIVKAKNWTSDINPNGLELSFKLVQGCKFIIQRDWYKPE